MADRAVPALPSRDLDRTEAFYGAIGFERVFRDDGWLVLRRGALELEFFPYPDLVPAESSFLCSIRVDDVDELYRRIREAGVIEAERGIPRLVPVRMQSWGQRAGYLIDPDGTQLNLIQNGA